MRAEDLSKLRDIPKLTKCNCDGLMDLKKTAQNDLVYFCRDCSFAKRVDIEEMGRK